MTGEAKIYDRETEKFLLTLRVSSPRARLLSELEDRAVAKACFLLKCGPGSVIVRRLYEVAGGTRQQAKGSRQEGPRSATATTSSSAGAKT